MGVEYENARLRSSLFAVKNTGCWKLLGALRYSAPLVVTAPVHFEVFKPHRLNDCTVQKKKGYNARDEQRVRGHNERLISF